MKVLDLAYDRIDKKLEELEATDDYFRGLRVGLIDALELIDILDMELDGRLPAGDDVREHTLDAPAPTTVREALDLAWELAHPVKEGRVIPKGAWLVDRRDNKITVEKNTFFNIAVDEWGEENIRTLEPLHDPEPDWLDAPAVIATPGWGPDRGVWVPKSGSHWKCACCQDERHWSDLHDVAPLYPLNEGTLNGTTAPDGYAPSNSMGLKNEETKA